MQTPVRIGTRESLLAMWQADTVKTHLSAIGIDAVLVPIKSEGDIDLATPLYEMGVQGIFTRSLDAALLNNTIDLAVHSMKDVPTRLPQGLAQAAVLTRGPVNDLLVVKETPAHASRIREDQPADIGTSSIRRKAQWLHRYPLHRIHNLRGNMQTRLKKLQQEPWDAAIFAQAGLERIGLRPANSVVLDWMLPAPAQGAIMVVARAGDDTLLSHCQQFNDPHTALCTRIERDFLRGLMGGCSTPVSALAVTEAGNIHFRGNICAPDGSLKLEIEKKLSLGDHENLGLSCAQELLEKKGDEVNAILQNR